MRSSSRFGRISPILLFSGLALETLPRRLKDEGASLVLRGILFAGSLTAKFSAFAGDITVFVSRRLDIKAVKKAVTRYEQVTGAKINLIRARVCG